MNFTLIETALIIMLTTLVVSVLFRAIRLPVILGYLVVGTLVGPHILGWIPDVHTIRELAEFGVALLMFTIGLEFSLPKLIALRYPVFVLGGLQVGGSIGITILIGLFFKMALMESIVMGCVVAMSSTAIVIKQLSNQFEAQSKHGTNAIGILLFQDLAVIPILIFIASFSATGDTPSLTTIFWALFKGVLALIAIISIGRWLLRRIFHLIAATRIIELFTLSVLLIALGSAWLTHEVGISYALGAFLAGIMLGETEFRHQINIEIRPFRDVLLGLFFVSIGMLVNITTWGETWIWILLLVVGLMIGKTLLVILSCRLAKYDFASSARTGIVLAQGGEFGFAILTVALAHKVIPPDYGQVVLAALLITFALAPILIEYNEKIAAFLFPKTVKHTHEEIREDIKTISDPLSHHIIICGYGRVGQNIARFLKKVNYPYIGLDLDPELLRSAKLAGDSIAYGNATHLEILKTAQLNKSSAVVISFNDLAGSISIIEQIRQIDSELPILVRCKVESEFETLRQSGATVIVAEMFEESLSLVNHLLQLVHIPKSKIARLIEETRKENYALLSQVLPGSFIEDISDDEGLGKYLRPIPLVEKSYAINHTLKELSLEKVEVISIRRGKVDLKPRDNLILQAGDILILYGISDHLDETEESLLT